MEQYIKSDDREKPKAYLGNAFSLSMLKDSVAVVKVETIGVEDVNEYDLYSVVGHEGAAQYYSRLLGIDVPYNRVNVTLQAGDTIIIGQINGRLPEGQILSADEMPPVVWKKAIIITK